MRSNRGKTIALAAVMVAFILVSYLFFDIPVALFCRNLDKGIKDVFEIITTLGIGTWYLIASFSLFLFFRFYRRNPAYAGRALFLFSSLAVAGILSDILKFIAGRSRPKMFFDQGFYGFELFSIRYELNSLPSGHAAIIFSLVSSLSLFFPRFRVPLYILALAVAASRVIITSHFLSDAIAGAFIGILTVLWLNGKKFMIERYS